MQFNQEGEQFHRKGVIKLIIFSYSSSDTATLNGYWSSASDHSYDLTPISQIQLLYKTFITSTLHLFFDRPLVFTSIVLLSVIFLTTSFIIQLAMLSLNICTTDMVVFRIIFVKLENEFQVDTLCCFNGISIPDLGQEKQGAIRFGATLQILFIFSYDIIF